MCFRLLAQVDRAIVLEGQSTSPTAADPGKNDVQGVIPEDERLKWRLKQTVTRPAPTPPLPATPFPYLTSSRIFHIPY
jgi:hypothetical protein